MESLGATIGVGNSLDRSYLNMNALSARLGESLELYGDVLMNPDFPEKELERLRGQTLATIQQEKAQPQAIINRLLPKLLFGEGHAYSNPSSGTGTEEAVSGLKSEDLARVLQALGASRQLHAAGGRRHDAGRDQAHAGAALRRLARAGRAVPKKNIATVALQPKPRVFLIDRAGAEQSQIVAVTVGPARAPMRITSASWRWTRCWAATSSRAST